ncbi:non-hydrolyzing UDP-N-acetylglucosamine 2-epimerase, partial [Chloroflexota bacterium]
MPEEINRILADHCSDYLFAPTEKAKRILQGEGIPEERIFVTGNTIVDTIYQNLEIAKEQGDALNTLGLSPKEYFLVTLHRQENVDNQARITSILKGLDRLANEFRLPVVYPVHPRAQKMINKFKLRPESLRLIDPLDYLSFLQLESLARLILTDSGGIQEEACILGNPCVTLRDNTERPETIEVGSNILAGASPDKILECSKVMLDRRTEWDNPFGDGKAGRRIIDILEEKL